MATRMGIFFPHGRSRQFAHRRARPGKWLRPYVPDGSPDLLFLQTGQGVQHIAQAGAVVCHGKLPIENLAGKNMTDIYCFK